MKKLFLITVLLGGILNACSNNSSNQGNTHEHKDGSIHEDHTETSDQPTEQEEFTVDSASADTSLKAAPHSHDGSENHTH